MKRRWILLLAGLFTGLILSAQNSPNTYWVKLKDKTGTPFQVSHPEAFLSQRSIDRRQKQQISIDETDLPVSPVYLENLKKLGIVVVHTSKWLNGVTVRTADTTLIKTIATLPFVQSVELTKPAKVTKSARIKLLDPEENSDIPPASYGNAYNQLSQLNGQYLHNKGFRGKGIQIAILDAGFWQANTITAFDSLRNSKRILGVRDFVDPKSDIYQQNSHGMSVLSCMGGNLPGKMLGTAPDAAFYLYRSEDDNSEFPIEEDNWVAAAELADSVGVDVINSSLGYYSFDDPKMSHVYADLNGKKTRVTQGANMAFQKGILVFTSAGNEGQTVWRHIIAPTDGENVISVGAVDKTGKRASFSSIGPAYGGAIKPNVAATGSATVLINSSGVVSQGSGTSFSSPVLAGMGACLVQANPKATVKQLKLAIEQSASQYLTPDSLLGYGIPDFQKADLILKSAGIKSIETGSSWAVFPNPFSDYISLRNLNPISSGYYLVSIYNLQGVCVWQSNLKTEGVILLKNLLYLPEGILFLTIRSEGKVERFKMLKIKR
jgi:subtilisin family serine protease